MTAGMISILNVGAGDITVSFNQHDPAERERAVRMLKDMQTRGYAILVRLEDGTYTRALEIDTERGCYVIHDPGPSSAPEPSPAVTPEPAPRRRGRPRKSVPFENARAYGVARSAGG
jgi:hypothetical protein